jgi:hypothetical protein
VGHGFGLAAELPLGVACDESAPHHAETPGVFCDETPSATIAKVIQYRRLSALLLGAWLGASLITDIAVSRNFQTVDRFLDEPGSAKMSTWINEIGRARARVILRRNAGEENNWIFRNWERLEFAIGGILFLLLLFGDRPPDKIALAVSLLLLAIVAAEHILLTPRITGLGRIVDDLPATDPEYKKFWLLHGFYSGLDILKMLIGLGLAVRLLIRRKRDRELFAREYAASPPAAQKLRPGKLGNG